MTYYLTKRIRQEIGDNLKTARRNLKLKQVEVAVEAGINPSYYSKIERGEVNPSIEVVFKLIKALKVESSDILPF